MKRCRPDLTLQKIDVKALIAHLGGVTKTQILLIQGGFPISRNAVEKWIERSQIPYGRLVQIADSLEYCESRTLNLEPFALNPAQTALNAKP
jgi:hypothetical protein